MENLAADHEKLGATFGDRSGSTVVEHYGRPERAAKAVRNGVGVAEPGVGLIAVTGEDRHEYVDNAVTNTVPTTDGAAVYTLLLDPQGQIEEELTVFTAEDKLLVLTPAGHASSLAADWSEKVFIEDVEIEPVTADLAVFAVHGPLATEKLGGTLEGGEVPQERFSFTRGQLADVGVTICRIDAPCGEESFLVISSAAEAPGVHDALLTSGTGAAPIGRRTLETLALEAGTPRYRTELAGRLPNVVGSRSAIDFEKGCFPGQEVVSRIENRGQPNERLVGLTIDGEAVPAAGAAVVAGDRAVGEVTSAVRSPTRGPIAFALLEYDCDSIDLAIRTDGSDVPATRIDLPFVDGSEQSGRLPRYS